MTTVSKEGLRACLHRLMRQARQCRWSSHLRSEKIECRGLDGTEFLFSLEGIDGRWRTELRVSEMDEEDCTDSCILATRTCNLLGWCHHDFDNTIEICQCAFDDDLQPVSTEISEDIVEIIWKDLTAVLQTKTCPCERARMHSSDSECALCLLEGGSEDHTCPVCWNGLPSVCYKTICCDRGAHLECLARCGGRCFNCRKTPLLWKRVHE